MPDAKLDLADELLVAYVDGELDAQRHAMVAAAIEREPAVARRVEAFMLSRDLLQEAFPVGAHTAQPPAGIRAAMAHLGSAHVQRPGRVVTAKFGGDARAPQQDGSARATGKPAMSSRWITAIAASLAVCVVGALTYAVWHTHEQQHVLMGADVGWIERGNPLYAVLESAPSARVVAIGRLDDRARSVLTFRARDGRYCREFEVIASVAVSTGLACRSQGNWRMEILLTGGASPPDASQSYQPAAGHNEQAMAVVIEGLKLGDPLSPAEESRLLSTGWR